MGQIHHNALADCVDLPGGDLTYTIPDALAHTYYERLASCAYSNGNSIAIGISAGKASGKGKNIFDVGERGDIFDVVGKEDIFDVMMEGTSLMLGGEEHLCFRRQRQSVVRW